MEPTAVGAKELKLRTPSLVTSNRVRRKFSIPISLPPGGGLSPPVTEHAAFRRRFSNVGDVVTRKLSTTIGWRTGISGNPPQEIVAVGRAMCTLYVRTRLKRAGLFNRKLGLTRVRSVVGTLDGCSNIVRDIFPCMSCACTELERMHPKLYSKIHRHTGPGPTEGNVGLLLALGHHILRSEPTWGKIVAIYCIAGGLAVDCVRQGQPEQLHLILEDMTELFEERIAYWIQANGGWGGLGSHCHQMNQEVSVGQYLTIFGLVTVLFLVAYLLVRFCIKIGT
ncbi:bcl-2-related ovarian killer protein-like [Cylas formicarius]|uniref:bcl-2-related ovarian killer protein-like n=1 Tax=Cylas formicarius TaxID=197179 RepID=UPI0029584F63|nr:bcl-2-related ovarian killer protein-like [Cylas formicarius]